LNLHFVERFTDPFQTATGLQLSPENQSLEKGSPTEAIPARKAAASIRICGRWYSGSHGSTMIISLPSDIHRGISGLPHRRLAAASSRS
jgi:hypothetical protein